MLTTQKSHKNAISRFHTFRSEVVFGNEDALNSNMN